MTDSASNDLENLVIQYEQGVANHETGDAQSWLDARTEIESHWEALTPEQIERIETSDQVLIQNAGQVASRLAASNGGSLSTQRTTTPRPPEQWWYYLDVIAHVSDYFETEEDGAKAPASLFSRLLTAIEIIVLVVAIFFLGQRILQQVNPSAGSSSSPASNSTPIPTFTPAPTGTLDPVAFDMSKAALYKSTDGVIEMKTTAPFKPAPDSASPGVYQFSYDVSATQSAVLQIAVGQPSEIYTSTLQLPNPATSPQDALTQLSKSTTDPSVKFTAVQPGKIGTLDAQTLGVTVAGSQGQPGSQLEFRIAPLSDGKIVLLVMRTTSDLWAQAQPTLNAMVDSLVVHPDKIPTPTPTPTLHPLEVTATALQKQILALTPTMTPTPAATGAATGSASSAAGAEAGAGGSAATPPAAGTAASF